MGNFRPRRGGGSQGNSASRSSKPPLTHFLCIPLVNERSIYQLERSLTEFKSSIPLVSPPGPAAGHAPDTPLVPYGALRPLGTLHFTLGVMSLTTPKRLDEVLSFLRSLDIASIMQEVEQDAKPQDQSSAREPLSIDLVSLHALPRARAATILHASPLDTTGRLYPFCVKLRDMFIEAGFMHRDMVKSKPSNRAAQGESSRDNEDSDGNGKNEDQEEAAANPSVPEGKPRPLLLHATIANTVYLGKRRQQGGKGPRGTDKSILKFDATELLEMFAGNQHKPHTTGPKDVKGKGLEADREPFTWAKNIPIDRICICEMGAKPVSHNEAKGGPVLGQEYRMVEQRQLD
ncbi:hypothetical protein MGYG_06900 [Nannizzia gypsea CBS 118893]|uniref:A-kinase anchor protein 7-like phosphoesterase domain-containing protein n=1 Tax=Arthroderma gypseum (strain ATCC MYA-4604 / CBS 118893) TaxID=535722 RepID=E4V1I7_ARTGP|nr:hypothetical protein MGYG_06900 [Nannizzia gypsea CBS 118893]EFR03902.1 hypothetical protein MGYG_06900 [Nannizzia gypsea CBS 118893]